MENDCKNDWHRDFSLPVLDCYPPIYAIRCEKCDMRASQREGSEDIYVYRDGEFKVYDGRSI